MTAYPPAIIFDLGPALVIETHELFYTQKLEFLPHKTL
jgi:hypothetical protein